MIDRLLFTILITYCVTGYAQKADGPFFDAGIGIGYSKHADSYKIDTDVIIKDHSGFRAIVLNMNSGWNFTDYFGTSLFYKWQPSNTTISPYSSHYYGVQFNFSPFEYRLTWLTLGIGDLHTRGEYHSKIGSGKILTLGMVNSLFPHAELHSDISFGKMKNERFENYVRPSSGEFMFTLTVNYVFHRE